MISIQVLNSPSELAVPVILSFSAVSKYVALSLSIVVLNSRDWSEIIWLPKNLRFKNQPSNRLYPKKPTGMHWSGCNDAVP